MGGLGKTELVKILAKEIYDTGSAHCLWIDAENQQIFSSSLQDLAADLDISTEIDDRSSNSIPRLLKNVLKQLKVLPVLLILDNLDLIYDDVEKFITSVRKNISEISIRILVTTRSRDVYSRTIRWRLIRFESSRRCRGSRTCQQIFKLQYW